MNQKNLEKILECSYEHDIEKTVSWWFKELALYSMQVWLSSANIEGDQHQKRENKNA